MCLARMRRYGSYDKSISVTRNVNLPDSLLSRFDMLFVVLDCMTESRDRQVSGYV
jgi:DNA replication licensing factor MCM3